MRVSKPATSLMKKAACLVVFISITVTGLLTSHKAYDKYVYARQQKELVTAITMLVTKEIDGQSFNYRTNFIRNFIHSNSTHLIDQEFYTHWRDLNLMLTKFHAYATGKTDQKIHMECSTRTKINETLLQSLGYRTRSVDIYQQEPNFPSHSFLEVFNKDTNHWEIQDPDYNIFWKNKHTGERASIQNLIKDPMRNYIPCIDEHLCGDAIPSEQKDHIYHLYNDMDLAITIDRTTDERPLHVNKARFDLNKKAPVKGQELSFCEYMPKNCRGDINIY